MQLYEIAYSGRYKLSYLIRFVEQQKCVSCLFPICFYIKLVLIMFPGLSVYPSTLVGSIQLRRALSVPERVTVL